jgi:hypothetical protein
LSLSREATPLIRPDIRHTEILKYYYCVPLKRGHPLIRPDIRHTDSKILLFYPLQERPPLLSGQISEYTEILKYYYFVPLKKGHPSYQARYQAH